MFWVFVVWVGVVLVGSMVLSAATAGSPFPGVWGRPSDRRGPRGGAHRPAYAGRLP